MTKQETIDTEHLFLDYRRADVHFVYSFLWKANTAIRNDIFTKGLASTNDSVWKSPLIHERIIGEIDGQAEESTWVGAYQPNFVFERRCMELSGNFSGGRRKSSNLVHLVVPMRMRAKLPRAGKTTPEQTRKSSCEIHPIL